MARFTRDLVLNKPDDFVQFIMNDFLQKNQFEMSDWKGEAVFRAGDAMVEGFKYLKWTYNGGVFHLEAWLKGMGGGEMDLDGFVGTLQKKPYKDSLEQLFAALQQPLPANGPQDMNPQGAAPQGGPQPIPVQTVDNSGAATLALVFGIISIILALLFPLGGIILAGAGIYPRKTGVRIQQGWYGKGRKDLCIIAWW